MKVYVVTRCLFSCGHILQMLNQLTQIVSHVLKWMCVVGRCKDSLTLRSGNSGVIQFQFYYENIPGGLTIVQQYRCIEIGLSVLQNMVLPTR